MPVNWKLTEPRSQNVQLIRDTLKIPDLAARLLVNRGIDTVDKAQSFCHPDILNMHSPFLFRDMSKALDRIQRAIADSEGILIFGDKDADGVCSTAILYKLLHKLGARQLAYRVPEKMENYGISRDVVAWAVHQEFSLMITVDCGITANEEVAYANSLGLDVIITDHHEPHDTLPPAYAILNPKLSEDSYPFAFLSGGGTVYKLAQAMIERLDLPEYHDQELVVFDIETTGLNPLQDEIIEIGAVKVKNGVVLETFQTFCLTEHPIPVEATQINGITNEMVKKDGIPIQEALSRFVAFAGSCKLIGHNIQGFDLPFVNHALKRHLDSQLNNPIEDTLRMARVMLKKARDYKLNTVAQTLGYYIDTALLHRAVDDSRLAAEVYRRLILSRSARLNDLQKELLPLVAISTIADIMPLRDENRNLVRNGLRLLPYSSIGLIALFRTINLPLDNLLARDVSWNVSPLINSPGRMGDASLSVEILIANHLREAEDLAKELVEKDKQRKELVQSHVDKILSGLEVDSVMQEKFILIDDADIPRGITGLLSNKLSTQLQVPAIVISSDVKGESSGSVRVNAEVNVVNLLESMPGLFNQYGGHRAAGGFTIQTSRIPELRQGLLSYMHDFHASQFEEELEIDLELTDLEDITLSNLRYLENVLEPTGHHNPVPVFLIRNIRIVSTRLMGKDQSHMLMQVCIDKSEKPVIVWKRAQEILSLMKQHQTFDLVASPEINRYQNQEEARLSLIDIRGHS